MHVVEPELEQAQVGPGGGLVRDELGGARQLGLREAGRPVDVSSTCVVIGLVLLMAPTFATAGG